jgi:hypothetical protein
LWRTDEFLRINPADQLQKFGFVSDVWMQFLVFAECDVFIQDQPGSVFHVHPGQWSRQISAESLLIFGRMIREMDRVLAERKTLVGDGRRKFLADVCLRFNAMVADQCRKTKNLPDDFTLRRWVNAYLELIYPHAGFSRFPLLPLFEEFRSMTAALETAGRALHDQDAMLQAQDARLRELQEKADRFDSLEHSLVWRFVKPLVRFKGEVGMICRRLRSRHMG